MSAPVGPGSGNDQPTPLHSQKVSRAGGPPEPGRASRTGYEHARPHGPRSVTGPELPKEPAPAATQPGTAELDNKLAECTADLQRLKAEYDNYRKRVHRDRLAVREIAVANVLDRLLPVLDAIGQAREHGEVTGGFKSVADALETQLASLGMQSFGEAGDPFDPALHQAISHTNTDEVDRPTCTVILRPGYRVGAHLLRPAEVAVAEPPASNG